MKKEEKQMKTKKVIIGAVAASMLSLSVCSIAPVSFAAGETVQISVGKESAKAGEQFTVEVTLADIPSTGLQAVEFAVKFDSSLVSIDSIKAGPITETGAQDSDPTSGIVPVFDAVIHDSNASIAWSTSLDEASYWLKKDGVFCTITGTVASGAKDGSVAKLEVVPNDRSVTPGSSEKIDKVLCGYSDGDEIVNYEVSISDGSVTVGTGSAPGGLRGDANCDNEVNLADAVLIMQNQANPSKYLISEQGQLNGDVDQTGNGLTNKDALKIQQYTLGLITKDEL